MFAVSPPLSSPDQRGSPAGTSHGDSVPRGRPAHDMSSALHRIEQLLRECVTRDEVFDYLTRNPGSEAGEVAAGLGVGQGAVSAHLYRGKGRLFVSRAGRWYPVPAADELASSVE
jgi:hypothetical protein